MLEEVARQPCDFAIFTNNALKPSAKDKVIQKAAILKRSLFLG